MKNRGVALLIVLVTILVVVILAGVIINMMASQSRLTHHQVSRIQAYYASQAGYVYAFEMLRTGNAAWQAPSTHVMCRDVTLPGCAGAIIDPDIPYTIQSITINIIQPGVANCLTPPAGVTACIRVTADYTYTP